MHPTQADQLAKRIINTFRQTPPLTEWRDVLVKLDEPHATNTFELCRDTINDHLPIARYLTEYRNSINRITPLDQPDTGPHISPQMGRLIARKAYADECRSQGREPNWAHIDNILRLIPGER